jgi:hypothetical protein
MTSCSTTRLFAGLTSYSTDNPATSTSDHSARLDFGGVSNSQANASFQNNDLEVVEESIPFSIPSIKVQEDPIVEDKMKEASTATTASPSDADIDESETDTKKDGNRKARRRKSATPELKMSDRERQKREEMDQSSDQLIITLNPEQSSEEHVQLMKYLRDMQKQEVVIEI